MFNDNLLSMERQIFGNGPQIKDINHLDCKLRGIPKHQQLIFFGGGHFTDLSGML